MKQKIIILIALLVIGFSVRAQVTTATYNTLYQTQGQSLWQPRINRYY